jgi:hypothetical protein
VVALLAGSALSGIGLERYLEAGRAGKAAVVSGRAYAERRTPEAADTPLTGATVVAVPRSEALLGRLEQLREGARTSVPTYREAATLMQKAREAYERELWEAGAAELVRTAVADPAGNFDLGPVPEGRWLIVGAWEQTVDARAPRASRKDREGFLGRPRLVGFRMRLVWLRDVTLTHGERAELQLTDRNVWFTGVVEEREPDARSRY